MDKAKQATSSIAVISSPYAAEASGHVPIVPAGFLGDVVRDATGILAKNSARATAGTAAAAAGTTTAAVSCVRPRAALIGQNLTFGTRAVEPVRAWKPIVAV